MKIAIQANPDRGKEIISLLESLGGENYSNWNGDGKHYFYYIDENNKIIFDYAPKGYKLYTLEEFEKEFPFKIGDKVTTTGTSHPKIITGITDTQWGLRYVISEINFPDSKEMPHISQISLYKEMKEERNITLTLDKAKEWYKKGGELKEIALQAFTEKELTKVDLPKSWKEFCKNYPIENGESYINAGCSITTINKRTECRDIEMDRNFCPSQKSAKAHLAMMQLEQLRDCWWNGWEPEWNASHKYAIKNTQSEITIIGCSTVAAFLVFPTRQMAEEFLKCFRDLIEKARDLI